MKQLFFYICTCLLITTSIAQPITRITLGNQEVYTCEVDKSLLINLSKDGSIVSFGTEDTWGRPLPYMGRTEYYAATDDEAFRGKLKYVGQVQITYYASYDNELLKGKIKSLGSNMIDYYNAYDDESSRGKIKNFGATGFTYHASYDNEAFRGKIKSVGNTSITYFSSFDDKALKGKLKSLGNLQYDYYTSFDRREYQGAMKPNCSYNPLVNGIRYIIRN